MSRRFGKLTGAHPSIAEAMEDGTVVKVFTTGTEVQVFRLAGNVPTDTWSGNGNGSSNQS